jgi:hypothetical protein
MFKPADRTVALSLGGPIIRYKLGSARTIFDKFEWAHHFPLTPFLVAMLQVMDRGIHAQLGDIFVQTKVSLGIKVLGQGGFDPRAAFRMAVQQIMLTWVHPHAPNVVV